MARAATATDDNSPIQPGFQKVSPEVAEELMRQSNARRDWTEVRRALRAGGRLFLPDSQLTKQTAKYLALSLQRVGETKRLHVRKAEHDGRPGKLMWLGEERTEPINRGS